MRIKARALKWHVALVYRSNSDGGPMKVAIHKGYAQAVSPCRAEKRVQKWKISKST